MRGRDGLAADGGERVGLGAVGAAGAPGAHACRAAASSGRIVVARRSHCSWWRHRWETLIVTRSRNASSSSRSSPQAAAGRRPGPASPRRSAKVRTRRSICPRLYCRRSMPQSRRTPLAEGDVVVGPALDDVRAAAARRARAAGARRRVTRPPGRSRRPARRAAGPRRRGRPRRPRAACRRRCRSTRPRRGCGRRRRATARAPSRPSRPMPVRTTSSMRSP